MENEILAPDFVDADFALIHKGDSMINARIFDGDIVYIRQQDTVENGEIAAVLCDDLVYLGRIWNRADGFVLWPENPTYRSQAFRSGDGAQVVGKAVAFTSVISDLEVSP